MAIALVCLGRILARIAFALQDALRADTVNVQSNAKVFQRALLGSLLRSNLARTDMDNGSRLGFVTPAYVGVQ